MKDVYVGMLISSDALMHYGVAHDHNPPGRGSGRWAWGSGKNGFGSFVDEVKVQMKNPEIIAKADKYNKYISDLAAKGSYLWKLYCNASWARLAVKIAKHASLGYLASNPANWPSLALLGYNGKQIFDEFSARAKNALLDRRINKESTEIDSKTGFRKKSREFTPEEDMENVNPLFKTYYGGYTNNCMLCTTTYDMRRRGYDVKAKNATRGFFWQRINEWYPKAVVYEIPREDGLIDGKFNREKYSKAVIDELKEQPNGARGNLMFSWNIPLVSDGGKVSLAGHSVVYEIVDNKILIRDCQANKVYTDINKFLKHCNNVDYVRLDNRRFDPEKIKECCK